MGFKGIENLIRVGAYEYVVLVMRRNSIREKWKNLGIKIHIVLTSGLKQIEQIIKNFYDSKIWLNWQWWWFNSFSTKDI